MEFVDQKGKQIGLNSFYLILIRKEGHSVSSLSLSFSLSLTLSIDTDHLETIDNCTFVEVTNKKENEGSDSII